MRRRGVEFRYWRRSWGVMRSGSEAKWS